MHLSHFSEAAQRFEKVGDVEFSFLLSKAQSDVMTVTPPVCACGD
jgi:hypothetical protein